MSSSGPSGVVPLSLPCCAQPAHPPEHHLTKFPSSPLRRLIFLLAVSLPVLAILLTIYRSHSVPLPHRLYRPFRSTPHPSAAMSSPTLKRTATVIFSHGLGDSSAGWSFLADQLGVHLPWVKWVFPNAPIQKVTLNMGMEMPSWFDITGLSPDAKEDEAGLLASVETIRSLIKTEVDAGIPTERIVVGGFSQGATIAILTGLTNPSPLAGVAALSGFLPLKNKIKDLQGPNASQLDVFWAHGVDDPVVRYDWGSSSVNFLKNELGLSNVTFKSYPGLVHSACPAELKDLLDWLKTRIPNQ